MATWTSAQCNHHPNNNTPNPNNSKPVRTTTKSTLVEATHHQLLPSNPHQQLHIPQQVSCLVIVITIQRLLVHLRTELLHIQDSKDSNKQLLLLLVLTLINRIRCSLWEGISNFRKKANKAVERYLITTAITINNRYQLEEWTQVPEYNNSSSTLSPINLLGAVVSKRKIHPDYLEVEDKCWPTLINFLMEELVEQMIEETKAQSNRLELASKSKVIHQQEM